MADSLVLTGVKDVKKHTGTEMLLTRPKRGGDTHSIKEWWKGGGVSTCYAECSVFNVTVGGNTCKLVIDSSMSTNVRIDHDGAFGFTFYGSNEVSRAALFTDSYVIIEHYVFPRISGGQVMTVTPAGAASKPGGAPADTAIGTVTISGDTTPADSTIESYSVAIDGDATSLTYAWSVSGAGTASGGTTGSSFSVAYSGTTDPSTVTCVVTSGDGTATDSPATGTLAIEIPTA
jgi:hypothetical protein